MRRRSPCVPEVTALGPLLTLRMDPLAKLERLDLPVLVVHGSNDTIVPPEMAQRLFAAARGPKRLVMVEGATHSGVLRRAGAEVFAAIRELTAVPH